MPLLQTTTNSNKNITSDLLVGTFTAAREYASMMAVIIADQVAGNGDYIVYLTRQLGGVGTAYKSGVTTVTIDSGVTSLIASTILFPVSSGDVVKCYVKGTAGDTTTPDITCEFWDLGYLRPTTDYRTLDVSSGGEAGIDWANIGSPSTSVSFSGTTVATATTVTNPVTAGTVSDKTGYSLAATYDPAKTAAQAGDAMTLTSGERTSVATAVWSSATRTLTSFGTLVADIWSYGTRTLTSFATLVADIWSYTSRTLTQTAAQITAALSGSTLTLTNRVTFDAIITGLTIPATWTEIYLTAKENEDYPDARSILQIRKSNPGVGTDGIQYIMRSEGNAVTRVYGSLTVNQPSGTITIAVRDDADFSNAPKSTVYDIKCIKTDGSSQLLVDGGTMVFRKTPTING